MAKRKNRKAGEADSPVLKALPLACRNESVAVEFLERQRWSGKPKCPHCEAEKVYQMRDRRTGERSKRFLWRCRECRRQFTVRIGTVFEDSRIPLRHWCFAFWAACASKKGVSALQISRQCNLSYKSALFMMHRIRWAMADDTPKGKLGGTVEVDETYVGGKPRPGTGPAKRGRGTKKTPVVALVQRNGAARARVIADVTAGTLKGFVRKHADRSATVMTDEWPSYGGLHRDYLGGHFTVSHGEGEYVRGVVHTNTAESFFALLKRGVHGTFHNVSKEHLHRYVAEFLFRWNTRRIDDGQRLAAAIRASDGKRLRYRA